jgi:hypothetical protein
MATCSIKAAIYSREGGDLLKQFKDLCILDQKGRRTMTVFCKASGILHMVVFLNCTKIAHRGLGQSFLVNY